MLNAFDLDPPSLAQELFPEFMAKKPSQDVRSPEAYKPAGHSPEDIRAWLQRTIEQEKVTATEWARISGLAPSTLNRFLNSSDHSANLTARTIDNLAVGMRRIAVNRDRNQPDERHFYQVGRRLTATVDVPVIGSVSAHNEKQSIKTEYYRGRNFITPVMYDVSRRPIAAFALTDHVRKLYPSGTILLTTPVFGWKHYPIKNAKYIYHEKVGDDQVRATIFRLVKDPNGSNWFMPLVEQSAYHPGLFLGMLRDKSVKTSGKATFLIIGSISPDSSLQAYYDEAAEAERNAREEDAREQDASDQSEDSDGTDAE